MLADLIVFFTYSDAFYNRGRECNGS